MPAGTNVLLVNWEKSKRIPSFFFRQSKKLRIHFFISDLHKKNQLHAIGLSWVYIKSFKPFFRCRQTFP